jgi:hypothetical protein
VQPLTVPHDINCNRRDKTTLAALIGGRIARIAAFNDPSLVPTFGFASTFPESSQGVRRDPDERLRRTIDDYGMNCISGKRGDGPSSSRSSRCRSIVSKNARM